MYINLYSQQNPPPFRPMFTTFGEGQGSTKARSINFNCFNFIPSEQLYNYAKLHQV